MRKGKVKKEQNHPKANIIVAGSLLRRKDDKHPLPTATKTFQTGETTIGKKLKREVEEGKNLVSRL